MSGSLPDIVLNRRGGVPVRNELMAQLELKILSGHLAPGQRLPSVRALARRLRLHPNTVSAAYRDLEAAGRVLLKRGSGVFVRQGGPSAPEQASGLDDLIRLAIHMAFRKGFNAAQVRQAVERWLAASPPERIVVVDPAAELAELLVHELRQRLDVPVGSSSLDDLSRDRRLLTGALALALPYHLEAIGRLAPGAAVETVNLQMSEDDRRAILELPEGSIVLVVSHAPTVLPLVTVLLKSLRGDELLVEARLLSEAREWRRLVGAADLVLADALSVEALRRARPRCLREVRAIPPSTLARLREALCFVVPRPEAGEKP
jgi:GntR family transcriptional regulator